MSRTQSYSALGDAARRLQARARPTHDHCRWTCSSFTGTAAVGFTWIAIVAFLRLVTNTGIMPSPMTTEDALDQVERWLRSPNAVVVEPGSRHLAVVSSLLKEVAAGANLINDAHLAALAIEYDSTIVSFDRNFARFNGLHHRVPGYHGPKGWALAAQPSRSASTRVV